MTGVRRVYRPAPVYLGQFALQLDVNLVVGDERLSKGEAFVDVLQHPPLDESVGPYDFETSAITCWVYLPVGAHGENKTQWIAFQVFAKDIDSHSEYGTWTRIQVFDEGNWVRIFLKPRRYAPPDGYISPEGFNPTMITTIGVKIGTDDYYAKKGVSYKGPVYIDACTWK